MVSSLGNRKHNRICCDYDVIVSESIKGRMIDLSIKSLKAQFREPIEILTEYKLCLKCPGGDVVVDAHSLDVEEIENNNYLAVFVFENNLSPSGINILKECIESCLGAET